jgi:hypothetical protein
MGPPLFSSHILSEFRTDVISEGLWFLIVVCTVSVSMVMSVRVICRADVIHFQYVSAFWAALDWSVSGHLKKRSVLDSMVAWYEGNERRGVWRVMRRGEE